MAAGRKTGGRQKGTPNKPKTPSDAGASLSDTPSRSPADPTFAMQTSVALPPYRLARIDSLVEYERNARTHSPAQIDMLARLITEFGWTNPVLVDAEGGILAGHGRVLAARQLGMDVVPTLELAHLTAAQRRAYVIADNESAEKSGWDKDLLRLELGELREEGFDLTLTGFDQQELNALLLDPAFEAGGTDNAPAESKDTVRCPACGHEFANSGVSDRNP